MRVVIAVMCILRWSEPGGILLLCGAIAYLIGPFGITMLRNVPLNNQLAKAEPAAASEIWPAYQKHWQLWNHIRTYIGIASIALLAAGLGSAAG